MRANDQPFMTRALRKAVMLRYRLRNRYNIDQAIENWNKFRKHRNSCVKLFRKEKRNHYNNLDISLVTDNNISFNKFPPSAISLTISDMRGPMMQSFQELFAFQIPTSKTSFTNGICSIMRSKIWLPLMNLKGKFWP